VNVDLTNTTASQVDAALVKARRRGGGSMLGMVLTLVVVADEQRPDAAVSAATLAAGEHPCRILVVVRRPSSPTARLDAELCLGEGRPSETVFLHLHGALAHHADSVLLPLLLPDTPVAAFWPANAPDVPAEDAVGALAQRRITDAAAAPRPLGALRTRAQHYTPGDTDLSWTRATPWRSMLAAAFDQPHGDVVRGRVGAERDNPSAELLALWLEDRLGIEVERVATSGPGVTEARLSTTDGDIALVRKDGRLATFTFPGWPERPVALKRRDLSELLAEELRRLDPDDVYAATLARILAPIPSR
jgi:glucose-6-phosphate dehydrogenase assembly protein OpcA